MNSGAGATPRRGAKPGAERSVDRVRGKGKMTYLDEDISWAKLERYKIDQLAMMCMERGITFSKQPRTKKPFIDEMNQYYVRSKEGDGEDIGSSEDEDEEEEEIGDSRANQIIVEEGHEDDAEDEETMSRGQEGLNITRSNENSEKTMRFEQSPKIKIPEHKGDMSTIQLTQWMHMVEIAFQGREMSEDQKIQHVVTSLRETASEWWYHLPNKPKTLKGLLERMKDDMGSDAGDIQLKTAFNQLQQNKNQNILMWGLTVQSFARKAGINPTSDPAVSRFIIGLRDPAVKRKVGKHYDKTWDGCYEYAKTATKTQGRPGGE